MSLSIQNISKSYGIHTILQQVSFTLNDGQRVGLVGANGVGKSTLLKIIVGEIEADSGTIKLTPHTSIGYLAQAIEDFGDQSLAELIAASMQHLHNLESQMRHLEEQMASTTDKAALAPILEEYQESIEQFERAGGYEIDHLVEKVFSGLGVASIPRHRRFATLSGGEKARVGLALLLLQNPDVLILDEPTNHLDINCLEWLENYLQDYRGAMLLVSHDREFLNRTVTAILEIDEHSRQAKLYTGNYNAYLAAKTLERQQWAETYLRQQEEIKTLRQQVKTTARQVAHNRPPRDGDKFLKHYKRGRVEESISSRVRSVEEKLRRLEEEAVEAPPEPIRFSPDFDPKSLKGHTPLAITGLLKRFNGQPILDHVTLSLDSRSRIVIVGPNGAGKSTLLKLIIGLEKPDAGEIYINPQVKIGYMDQEQESLDGTQTLFQAYRAGLPDEDQTLMSLILGSGLFQYEELQRKVSELSQGQRRKLQIARLMAERANLLLLDEPTNYVSFDVLETFEEALRQFPGPILAVSHDRRFVETFGGEVWELDAGNLYKRIEHSPVISLNEG